VFSADGGAPGEIGNIILIIVVPILLALSLIPKNKRPD